MYLSKLNLGVSDMKRTYNYEKKPSQSTTSVQPTASFLQTRGFAPIQTDLDENATFRPSGYTENFLEKIINQRSTESSNQPVQRKPHNRLKAIASQRMAIQAKLDIGEPNDKYEQEADATASKVVQQINSTPQDQSIQREAAMEEEEELQMKPISSIQRDESMAEEDEELQMKPLVQRRENLGEGEASTDLESSIQSARGGGQSLDASLQDKMGQAMGADFSGVKVHTDSRSDQLNKSIQAKAFTTGQDVFFKQGQYNPTSKGGQELIAHELTHVIQQNNSLDRIGQSKSLIQCFFDLKESDQATVGVTTAKGISFPGHEELTEDDQFLADDKTINRVDKTDAPDLAVSDDGKMAIESLAVNGGREAEAFFAESSLIKSCNKTLKSVGSKYDLDEVQKAAMKVPELNTGKLHTLSKVVAGKMQSKGDKSPKISGEDLKGQENCNEMAEDIIAVKSPSIKVKTAKKHTPHFNPQDLGLEMSTYLAAYILALKDGKSKNEAEKLGNKALKEDTKVDQSKLIETWDSPQFKVIATSQEDIIGFNKALGVFISQEMSRLKQMVRIFNTKGGADSARKREDDRWEQDLGICNEAYKDTYMDVLDLPEIKKFIDEIVDQGIESINKPLNPNSISVLLENRKTAALDIIN
jgi:hypothetical protein